MFLMNLRTFLVLKYRHIIKEVTMSREGYVKYICKILQDKESDYDDWTVEELQELYIFLTEYRVK